MILRPLMRFSRFSIQALAAAIGMALVAGCGQKGALYLRDKPPAGVKIPRPPTPKPIPYPVDPAAADSPASPDKQD